MVNMVPCNIKADFPPCIAGENRSAAFSFQVKQLHRCEMGEASQSLPAPGTRYCWCSNLKGCLCGDDDRTSDQKWSTWWSYRQDWFDIVSLCEIMDLQQHRRAITSPLLRLCCFVCYSQLRFVAFIRHKKSFSLISLVWYLLQQNIYTASYFCQI